MKTANQSLTRRALIAAACTLAFSASAWASDAYPNKVISLVVPTAAGGGNDAMARVLAKRMSEILGQQIVVENKAGGNGAIASEYVARAKPDGYTILFGYIATHAMNPALQKLRYDPVASFSPIGMVCNSPTLMVANPKLAISSVPDLIKASKADPNGLNYASAGSGTAPHFAAELFKLSTGTQIMHVPYKGSAPAMTDTMAGQTQIMFPSLFTAYPFVQTGKLKPLAVAGPRRSELMPDVPTLAELGIQGVDVSQWYAMFAPARTPVDIVTQLNQALNQTLQDKTVAKNLELHGATVEWSTPEQLGTLVSTELKRWQGVVARAGLTPD